MEVGSGNGFPSSALSNFAADVFTLDGVQISSREGFLQSLKFKDLVMQDYVCTLVGRAAKAKGRGKNWHTRQVLYWRGVEYPRSSDAYQNLLDRAFEACFNGNNSFKKALIAAGKDAVFTHSIGRIKEQETVLTRREFCSRLMKLKKLAFSQTLNKYNHEKDQLG